MKKILASLMAIIMILSASALMSYGIDEENGKWIGAWGTSPVDYFISLEDYVGDLRVNGIVPAGTTIRTELTVSASGEKLRLKFSNVYGNTPINITEAAVARTAGESEITGESTYLTFGGSKSVTIEAGGEVWSDDISFSVKAGEKISVSTYYASGAYIKTAGLFGGVTYEDMGLHGFSRVDAKRFNIKNEIEIAANIYTYHVVPFLTNIDVLSKSENARSVVFIGDSTLVNETTSFVSTRLLDAGYDDIGIVNEAIMGNRLCADGTGLIGSLYGENLLSRFSRDALSVSGADTIFVKIGANDILHPSSKTMNAPYVTTDEIIDGYKQLINMAKEAGKKIYFITITPWNGYVRELLGGTQDIIWSPELQEMTDTVNNQILTQAVNFGADGAIDVSAVCDINDPTKMAERFTLDGIHFTMFGSMVLCDSINIEETLGLERHIRTISEITGVNPYADEFDPAPTKDTIGNVATFIRQLLSSFILQFEKIRLLLAKVFL